MPQIFKRRSNAFARGSLAGLVVFAAFVIWIAHAAWWSPYTTRVDIPLEQPVPFSHQHHYSGLGIDCRYCHTSVEESSFAGMPATETCMTCHSQVWKDAPVLAPVRESLATSRPIQWNRVTDLPDFVFFDHSIHVAKGVSCFTCHGRIDRMPITRLANNLYMKWCLECHRNPERFIRPREEVYNPDWQSPKDREALGKQLMAEYGINPEHLTDCSVCHR